MSFRCTSALRTTALAALAALGLPVAAVSETGALPMVAPRLSPLVAAAIADAAERLGPRHAREASVVRPGGLSH